MCAHASASRRPSLVSFPFLSFSVSTLLEALELHAGPEPDSVNSWHCHCWVVPRVPGRLGMLGNPGPEKGSHSLESHSESVGSSMGLEPQAAACLYCSVLPVLRPSSREEAPRAHCQDPGKHIFSLCPHQVSSVAQQPERSPCQWVGRLQDVSSVQQGARDRDRKAKAPGWSAVMSPRMSSLLSLRRILGTSDLELARLASPGRRKVLRVGSPGQADWWQWRLLALCPRNWGLLLEAKSQRQWENLSRFSCWDSPSVTG